MKVKALLLDIDGVMLIPRTLFGQAYSKENNVDLESFFEGPFKDCLMGRLSLREAITNNAKIWSVSTDQVDDIINEWFSYENVPNYKLLSIIHKFQNKGVSIFAATNQEALRSQYIEENIFPELFEDFFASYKIAALKPELKFFEYILEKIKIKVQDILFIDDTMENISVARKLGFQTIYYRGSRDLALVEGYINES